MSLGRGEVGDRDHDPLAGSQPEPGARRGPLVRRRTAKTRQIDPVVDHDILRGRSRLARDGVGPDRLGAAHHAVTERRPHRLDPAVARAHPGGGLAPRPEHERHPGQACRQRRHRVEAEQTGLHHLRPPAGEQTDEARQRARVGHAREAQHLGRDPAGAEVILERPAADQGGDAHRKAVAGKRAGGGREVALRPADRQGRQDEDDAGAPPAAPLARPAVAQRRSRHNRTSSVKARRITPSFAPVWVPAVRG